METVLSLFLTGKSCLQARASMVEDCLEVADKTKPSPYVSQVNVLRR